MGKVRGVAETEDLNVPILISSSVAGKNVPRSLEPFIKVMKSRVAHYESDSPVHCELHRDTHGQILSSLDCSDAFVACERSQGLPWDRLKAPGEGKRRNEKRPLCQDVHNRLD